MIVYLALFDASAAPATVLEHTLDVTIDYRQQLSSVQKWVVRIDDPAMVVAGLPAPPGMDGAEDNGALVLEDLFVVPEGVAAGDVFTLTASSKAPRGSHSGVFASAVGLPIEHAMVKIAGPANQPLTVWADPGADPIWSTARGKSAVLEWTDVPEDATADAVFSTWTDWNAAGDALDAAVDARLADKSELGRELAQNLKSTNLAELVRRVFTTIEVVPGEITGWEGARDASAVAEKRSGSPAERGLVLLSVLREAGYTATPALYRSAADGPFPITIPGPALLTRPLVIAQDTAGKVLYIDPSNDAVAVPNLPRSLRGAIVWSPGDLPRRFDAGGAAAGTATLTTTVKIDLAGKVTWNTEVAATGVAIESIRSLLRTLDEDGRTKAMERLVRQGRPQLERINVTSAGTEDPYRDLKLTIAGADGAVFQPWGSGLKGAVQPALAPALAGWLPPNIRITETVIVQAPDTLRLLATGPVARSLSEDALIDRRIQRVGNRLHLQVTALRPYAVASAERDATGAAFLASEAPQGVEMVWFPPASGAASKALASAATGGEAVALQTLLWWSADNDAKARGVLKKVLKTEAPAALIEGYRSWAVDGDPRPWLALFELIEDPEARLQVLLAAADHGNGELAVQQAPQLLSDDAERNARVWLLTLKVRPDEATAAMLGGLKLSGPMEATVAEALATFHAERNEPLDLEKVPEDTPARRGLHLVGWAAEVARENLAADVKALRAEAPLSAAVARRGSEALLAGGLYEEGAEAALDAARISNDDPTAWAHCAEAGLLAGSLPLALDAARRASDLEPQSSVYARRLHHLAVLAADDENEAVARERSGGEKPADWPPTVDDLLAVAEPTSLLAVLQYHDAAVLASPVSLALRAQLRTDAGLLDAAARDSITLYTKHGESQGPALAFAATVGRVLGHGALTLMDSADDEVAKLTRMEYRLITNSSDPRNDARALKEQPRAADLLQAAGAPAAIAERTEGWPTDLQATRVTAPRGYVTNAILSGPVGVMGFSHTDRQVALVHVNGPLDLLPPPLSVLYRLQEPPIAADETTTLYRLTDGYLPLYGARTRKDGVTLWGFGFTAEAARRALRDGLK